MKLSDNVSDVCVTPRFLLGKRFHKLQDQQLKAKMKRVKKDLSLEKTRSKHFKKTIWKI
jgi:hypothetical protein